MASQLNNDDNLVVIYKGRMERDVIRVKLFSITTSVMGLVFQPLLYSQVSSLPALIATSSVAGFFTFVTPVLLHQLSKRYVNRITYNKEKDNYIAETTSFFFRQKQAGSSSL
jgi:transmembrane protein 70